MADGQWIIIHKTLRKNLLITFSRLVWLGKEIGKVRADQSLTRHTGRLHGSVIDIGDLAFGTDGDQRVKRGFNQTARVLRGLLLRGHITRRGEDAEHVALVVVI